MASVRGVEAMTQAATLIEIAGWTNELNQKVAPPTDHESRTMADDDAASLRRDIRWSLLSQLPPKRRLSQEWRQALQLLARNPRGTTKDMLVVGHGLSADMLAMLVLAGLAKAVTATLKAEGGTFTIERLHITDAGRRAIEG